MSLCSRGCLIVSCCTHCSQKWSKTSKLFHCSLRSTDFQPCRHGKRENLQKCPFWGKYWSKDTSLSLETSLDMFLYLLTEQTKRGCMVLLLQVGVSSDQAKIMGPHQTHRHAAQKSTRESPGRFTTKTDPGVTSKKKQASDQQKIIGPHRTNVQGTQKSTTKESPDGSATKTEPGMTPKKKQGSDILQKMKTNRYVCHICRQIRLCSTYMFNHPMKTTWIVSISLHLKLGMNNLTTYTKEKLCRFPKFCKSQIKFNEWIHTFKM